MQTQQLLWTTWISNAQMSQKQPGSNESKAARDLSLGFMLLLLVVIISCLIGLYPTENALSALVQWLGASVAGIAMVATAYVIILQARHGESASWSIALSRLGQLCDKAQDDERFSLLMIERSDPDDSVCIDQDDLKLTPQQTISLSSLFPAFEQIYVAINSVSSQSQGVRHLSEEKVIETQMAQKHLD